jgi:ferredoxin-type protein NapH
MKTLDKNSRLKHPGRFRLICQALFFAITNGYYIGFATGKIYKGASKKLCFPGLNCYSCPGALLSCPIGSLQSVLDSRKFVFSCYCLGIIMAAGSVFGRLVCGFLCPFGMVQDLLYKIPFPKKKKNITGHQFLIYIKYLVLMLFVIILPSAVVNVAGIGRPWFCEYICPSGTLFAGLPLLAANSGLRRVISWHFWWKMAVLISLLVMSLKYYRPFCKYLCPLGAMYGFFNKFSFYRYVLDASKCTKCGACKNACKMDIKVWEKPNSTECIRCGRCIDACKTGALHSTLKIKH